MADILQDESILLRPLEPEDLEFLYSCENDTNNWHVSNTLMPFSKYILKQYIESSAQDIYTAKQLRLIIELKEGNKPIGAIDLFDFDPYHQRAGIGIIISDISEQRKGYAYRALNLLINYCFSHLSLHQLYCNIGANNSSSINLFEKADFECVGEKKEWLKTNNGWESELIYQLIKP